MTSDEEAEWSKKSFDADVANHKMEILKDDGLYRHIKFMDSECDLMWFEIVTWPGSLTINGDMGTYIFSRADDMFSFFGEDGINPTYWAEKVQAKDDEIEEFSPEVVADVITRQFESWEENIHQNNDVEYPDAEANALLKAIQDHFVTDDEMQINYQPGDRDLAREHLESFWFESRSDTYEFSDVWELDLTDFTVKFLWNCHAITWAIGQYRQEIKRQQEEGKF